MLQPGEVLREKYYVERILGQGGMGIVAQAIHLRLKKPVAIKCLLPELIAEPLIVKRFLREAQAAASLHSENVCRVFDVGTLDTGCPYIVMEFMDGLDLRDYVTKHGRPSLSRCVDLILQTCDALSEAHAAGIIHRDLKPANLFIAKRANGASLLKVLDFGISKQRASGDEQITHTHAILGTPAYMSPEQIVSAKQVDARSDIWSLGIILYELLNGQRPFNGRTFPEMFVLIVEEPTPPSVVPLPSGLEKAVARCLQKDPDQRFQSVLELAAAIKPFMSSSQATSAAIEHENHTRDLPFASTIAVFSPHASDSLDSKSDVPITLSVHVDEMTTKRVPPNKYSRWSIVQMFVVMIILGFGVSMLWNDNLGPTSESFVFRPTVSEQDASVPADASLVDGSVQVLDKQSGMNGLQLDGGYIDADVAINAPPPTSSESPSVNTRSPLNETFINNIEKTNYSEDKKIPSDKSLIDKPKRKRTVPIPQEYRKPTREDKILDQHF